ncbi:serine protease HtrA [Tissierella creatinophila]|uniref:Putative serine protease HtrA n=1 Tax=Tissierella creatinophila DSM 6911 TaxID=1123403 RepID=A0A1U7M2F7_TISCR|nr:trypsin-like peptidase domain-containing protein [Tissierella creatinophila]OLS01503.1 putative serine protease HtrA [Tissierella creatinophila DSM 6911]
MNYDGNDRKDSFTGEENSAQERKSYASIPEDIYIEKEVKKTKKKRSFKGSAISYIILALVASIIGGLSSNYLAPIVLGNEDKSTPSYSENPITINTNDDISTVSAVVKKSMKSVVGITTLETVEDFFGSQDRSGLGSGVIIDSNGYILTNSHVVANGNAKEIKVLFENGDKENGKLLWFDPTLDLAVVKVNKTGLPAMELGNSDELEVGELAIAIGNPLGLEFERTVTSGIISGLNRSVAIDINTVMDNLIQTDASINPGNSGGPLLNANGEVIGINTAKIQSGEGLGFSIPINATKEIIKEVIQKGTFETVQLGIKGLDIKEYQSRLGVDLKLEKGVIILEILNGSIAQKNGLLNGDIVLKIDKMEVESIQSLKKILYNYKKGDKATLIILRNNKEEKIEINF